MFNTKPENVTYYLVLNHLTVRDANAISGNLIYGFPALTSIEGFVQALNRALIQEVEQKEAADIKASNVDGGNHPLLAARYQSWMLVAHEFEAKIYREHSGRDYTFLQRKAPLTRSGANPPIIEEGRIDLTLSLVIEISVLENLSETVLQQGKSIIKRWLSQARLAGGVIETYKDIHWLDSKVDDQQMKREIINQVGLGYVLCSGEALIKQLLAEDPTKDALDILLDTAKLQYERPENIDSRWQIKTLQQKISQLKTRRKEKGWIVPLMVGYQPISQLIEPHTVKAVRMPQYPTEFVEPIYSLGRWILTYQMISKDEKDRSLSNYFWSNEEEGGQYFLARPQE